MEDGEDWEEIEAGETTWRFETSFLRSHWTCLWGQGCQGIRPEPAEALNQGCCSVGADLQGDEAATVATLALFLSPEGFQHHARPRPGASSATTPAPTPGWSTTPASS